MNRRAALLSVGALLGSACQRQAATTTPPPPPPPPPLPPLPLPRRAFHYWRTVLRFSARETRALAALGIERLYVRLFDVDRGNGDAAPRPLAALSAGEAGVPAGIEVVPVVFLRERALRGLAPPAIGSLAADVWRAVRGHMDRRSSFCGSCSTGTAGRRRSPSTSGGGAIWRRLRRTWPGARATTWPGR